MVHSWELASTKTSFWIPRQGTRCTGPVSELWYDQDWHYLYIKASVMNMWMEDQLQVPTQPDSRWSFRLPLGLERIGFSTPILAATDFANFRFSSKWKTRVNRGGNLTTHASASCKRGTMFIDCSSCKQHPNRYRIKKVKSWKNRRLTVISGTEARKKKTPQLTTEIS